MPLETTDIRDSMVVPYVSSSRTNEDTISLLLVSRPCTQINTWKRGGFVNVVHCTCIILKTLLD